MLNEHVEDAVRERAPFVEKFLKENIETIDSRITTRGIGLLWGVDFGAFEGDVAKAVIHKAFENGLIVERVGRRDSVVKIMPELKVPMDTLEKGLNILAKSIREVVGELKYLKIYLKEKKRSGFVRGLFLHRLHFAVQDKQKLLAKCAKRWYDKRK